MTGSALKEAISAPAYEAYGTDDELPEFMPPAAFVHGLAGLYRASRNFTLKRSLSK